jgi:hypothetical protein
MKKLLSLILLVLLSGCKTGYSNQDNLSWRLYIRDFQITSKLQTDQTITHYDGSSEIKTITDEATANTTFLLLKLEINKAESGSGVFVWDNLYLVDKSGTKYHRIIDSFLKNHNFERLPSIDISFGNNVGWIAFEISNTSATQKLTVVYISDEGENRIPVTK